jgi:hypothetical protein
VRAWPILVAVGLTQCGRAATAPPAPDSSHARDAPAGRRPPLRTTIDLFESFVQGRGSLHIDAARGPAAPASLRTRLSPLPWTVAEDRRGAAGLLVVAEGDVNSDAMLAFVLHDGDSWDVPIGRLGGGHRLRFEALSLSGDARPELTVDVTAGASPARVAAVRPPEASLEPSGPTSVDTPVEAGEGEAVLSFRVRGGDVAVGEARLLEPDVDPAARYPWVALIVGDALRADALSDPALSRGAPALRAFASAGQRFTNAVTPGCHTRASVWSLMSGRDMMRIDPCLRGGVNPRFAGPELIHRFGNLFFTQYAWLRGYHTVFLGNNAFFGAWPGFQRIKLLGSSDSGTEETIAALPWLFSRYADERVVVVYYVSATHSASRVPARLAQRLGCNAGPRADGDACLYAAKVAHFDEALAAFEGALAGAGLAGRTLQILTADHGENLEDTSGVQAEVNGPGHWLGVTVAHGASCYASELRVPLVVAGPSVPREDVAAPVSSLDIAPTVLQAIGVTAPTELDGRPLPSGAATVPSSSSASSDRLFASYGFCTDSFVRRGTQFVHWLPDCGRRRLAAGGGLLEEPDELWRDGRRADRPPADVLAAWGETRWDWISERIPSPSLMIELGGIGRADLSITATGGATISDFGPSNTVYGLDRLSDFRREGPSTLRLHADQFPGRIFVSTRPALAPLRIRLERQDAGAPAQVALLGPEQLPVTLDGRELDPSAHRAWLVTDRRPGEPGGMAELPRLWWQTYSLQQAAAQRQAVEGFGRVLREWGYIR